MPVVINAETGLAEDLPDPLASQGLKSGAYHVPLNDLEGKPVTAGYQEASQLVRQGYTQPTTDQLKNLLGFAKFSSPAEQAKTFAEGAGQGATFGASTAAETAAGVNPVDIAARRAVNPGIHEIGQMAGLIGSELTGVGEGALLAKLGGTASKALGLGAKEAGALSQMGSRAVKDAIAFSGVQSGDEVSKMILGQGDPHAPVETALTHIGLSGLIGGGMGAAFGAISPLWKSANETKLGQYLQAMRDKAGASQAAEVAAERPLSPGSYSILGGPVEPGAMPGLSMAPNMGRVDELARKAGIELTPTMRAALSATPEWGEKFRVLVESATGSGKEAQGALREFVQAVHDKTLQALKVTPETVGAIQNMSENDLGLSMINAIAKDVDMDYHPLAEAFSKTKELYKDLPIGEGLKRPLLEEIGALALDQGYTLEGTPENRLYQNILKWVNKAENLQDLRIVYSTIGRQTEDPKLWKIGSELSQIVDNFESNVVERQLAIDRPDMLGKNKADRQAYSELMEDVRRLSNRLHPGAFSGPQSFLTQLSKMNPEVVLRRLTPTGDANLLEVAKARFPSLVPEMRQAYLANLVKAGAKNAKDPFVVQPFRLFDVFSKWSPELKAFALPEGAEAKISAAKELSSLNPFRSNSFTARNLDSMWSKIPGASMAMVSMAHGDNPLWGYIMGEGSRLIAREAPDAMTLATLKLLGDPKPVEASAFKTAVDFIFSTMQGENLTGKAVKNIFKSGAEVLPQRLWPKPEQKERLKKRLTQLELDHSPLLDTGGNTGYYLPEQGIAMGSAAARIVTALNQLRPNEGKMGVLSPNRKPSKVETAAYENALTIAEQPLVTLEKIKRGTLTMRDVELVKQFYPALHARISQKLMDEVIEITSKGALVPYAQRLAVSRFVGQPLDASMMPASIVASQPASRPPEPQTRGNPATKPTALKQFAAMYQTPLQQRARERGTTG